MKYPRIKSAIFFLALAACGQKAFNHNETPPTGKLTPATVDFKTGKGYAVNPFTGDSIQPIITSIGDTLVTGVPVPANGKYISPDSVLPPTVVPVPAGAKPATENAHPNVYDAVFTNSGVHASPASVTLALPRQGDTTHHIRNSMGRKIATGVKTSIRPKKTKAGFTNAIPALAPQMPENATCNIQSLDVDQGLPSSYIVSVLQDSKGYFWFGTNGNGIIRYDGKSFLRFTHREGLSNDYVYAIFEDTKGNLWFGTKGGVNCYDGEFFLQFTEREGMPASVVRSMCEDKNGNMWFGSLGGGISCYTPAKNVIVHYTTKEGMVDNSVYSIAYEKSNNSIWIATLKQGVSHFDGKTFTHLNTQHGLSSNSVRSICTDSDGRVWIGSFGGGIDFYDGKKFTRVKLPGEKESEDVSVVSMDKRGNIWFGTTENGAFYYDGKNMTHISRNEGLTNNHVYTTYEDREGNIWFGTFGSGICKYTKNSFAHFTEKQGLKNTMVYSVVEDDAGKIWFTTYGAGACCYDGKNFMYYTEKEGMGKDILYGVMKDSKGNLWFATTGGGVTKYDGKAFTTFTAKQGLSNNVVRCLREDKNGNIWMGTLGGGVCCYDGKTFTQFTDREGLADNSVYCIYEDDKGNLWFSTSKGGVSRYNGKTFTHFTQKEGLSSNNIRCVSQDNGGRMLFGTHGEGLNVYDGKKIACINENDGLSNNILWSICKIENNKIWLSTEKGLDLFECKNGEYSFVVFDKPDGLKGLDFFNLSSFYDSKKRLWWGSGKGLTTCDTKKFRKTKNNLAVQLQQVDINEKFADYRNKNQLPGFVKGIIQPFENYPQQLNLPYDQNHLSFQFIAFDWAAPHKIKYSYRMLGLNDAWSKASAENKADYRNLSYGDYTLQVCAMGESGVWSKPFEYKFIIYPPWWHTWWFRALLVCASLFVVYLLFRWRTAALLQRQKQLEQTVKERTAEVVRQKHIVEEKHKEITDSINYAECIQRSFLASQILLDENLGDYFVMFQPRDVVSGDFYWATKLTNGSFVYATADSTGHGVPGAIMSILNISSLEKAVEKENEPAAILNATRKFIIDRLKKDGSKEGGKDGMDCSLIVLSEDKKHMLYAAANNPVWIIRGKELIELHPDKMPVGKHDKDQLPFNQHDFHLQKGDVVYTLTDGMPDQFGGEKGKKFKYSQLKQDLISIAHLPMKEQEQKLRTVFAEWKGGLEQVDDVLIIGVRI